MDTVLLLLTGRNPFWTSTLLAAALVTVATFRQGWKAAIKRGMAAILFVLVSRLGLLLLFYLTRQTIDVELYGAEAALGYPAFLTGSWLRDHVLLQSICAICYVQLPLAVAVIWVTSEQARSDFRLFVALGLAGWIGYLLMPAMGPSAVNPHFPSDPRAALISATELSFLNCMPSLHAAWLIALWWASVSLPRLGRALCALYCIFALSWTLALGSHYAVDLVVAVPFTYGVRDVVQRRWRSLIYLGIVGAWFIALRMQLLTNRTMLAWVAVAATLVCSPALEYFSKKPTRDTQEPIGDGVILQSMR